MNETLSLIEAQSQIAELEAKPADSGMATESQALQDQCSLEKLQQRSETVTNVLHRIMSRPVRPLYSDR